MFKIRTKQVPVDTIQTHPENVNDGDVGLISESLEYHGQYRAIVVSEGSGNILAGNHTYLADTARGQKSMLAHLLMNDDGTPLTPDQELRIMLMDNESAKQATYDEVALAGLLVNLSKTEDELAGTGFDPDGLDDLLSDLSRNDDPYDAALPDRPEAVVKYGDVWIIDGKHRVMCGDSTNRDDVETLMDGTEIDLLVTSPPYNVGLNYEEYDDTEVDIDQYLEFIDATMKAWVPSIGPGRMAAWNIGVSRNTSPYRHLALIESYLTFWRNIVWTKVGVHLPTFHNTVENKDARRYHPHYAHEIIALFVNGKEPDYGDKIILPAHGSRDVWDWIVQAMASRDIPKRSDDPTNRGSNLDRRVDKLHPAVFPIDVPATLLGYLTSLDETVVDPFVGAGTTIMAAEQFGRRGYGMDIDPTYIDLTLARYRKVHPTCTIEQLNL